jgi:hypothetical protein
VPIRAILANEYGPSFQPEEIASLTAAFDAALNKLGLVDRRDPVTMTVAKLIIKLAKDGERDPKSCVTAFYRLSARGDRVAVLLLQRVRTLMAPSRPAGASIECPLSRQNGHEPAITGQSL